MQRSGFSTTCNSDSDYTANFRTFPNHSTRLVVAKQRTVSLIAYITANVQTARTKKKHRVCIRSAHPQSSSSSSDHVDSRGPLRQPRVATTTSLGPFSTNAEGCTVADLLDP